MELSGDDEALPAMDLPYELIEVMTKKQRKRLRRSYPHLPEYLFMNEK